MSRIDIWSPYKPEGGLKKTAQENVYVLYDVGDGSIVVKGTPSELKEWWWKEIFEIHSEVGGLSVLPEEEWKERFDRELEFGEREY